MKLFTLTFCLLSSVLNLGIAQAYPDLMKPVGTAGLPLKVFKDHNDDSLFWYVPVSIEPWTLDSQYKSVIKRTDSALAFIFRGQQSVSEQMLKKVAKANNTTIDKFTPVFYEYSKDLTCQNIYASDPNVTWLFPNAVGNFLEVVPVSIRVKNDRALMDEIEYLINNGGLACTVSVGFKAYSMAYKASYDFDLNQVYSRFEAGIHAEYFWFEADIHTILQTMKNEGIFKFNLDEDTSISQTTLDQKMNASFEDLEKKIITLIFDNVPKLPSGGLADRGKPFSLRTNYVRSEAKSKFHLELSSDKIKVKDTQIGLRIGNK